MTTTETPIALPPCPTWCTNKAGDGHDYDTDVLTTGAMERHHDWDPPSPDGMEAWVSISVCESHLDGVVTTGAPYIYASADQEMTAEQARQYSAALLVAADKLDELNSGAK